jgi:hypothetical protein
VGTLAAPLDLPANGGALGILMFGRIRVMTHYGDNCDGYHTRANI